MYFFMCFLSHTVANPWRFLRDAEGFIFNQTEICSKKTHEKGDDQNPSADYLQRILFWDLFHSWNGKKV